MNHWLVKSEPETYSWADFSRDGRTVWTGVRSFPARLHLRAMQRGDLACFYHSGTAKQIVGIAKVAREAYPDPTADEGEWSCVDLVPVKALANPVTLADIRADKPLAGIQLLRQTRLSVAPLTPAEFNRVLTLGRTKL